MGKSLQPADIRAPLRGAVNVEEAVRMTPERARTKGMFFRPLADELGPLFDELAPKLIAPPRAGRYFAFLDYPSRDHVRLIEAVARKRFPHLDARESYRRLGFESFGEFARSTLGRVALGLLDQDVGAAMRRFGDGYAMLVKNTRPVRCTAHGVGCVELVFDDPLALPEYVLGIFEAIVLRGARTPHVSVRADGGGTYFEVRWT
jgi:uncharacterized protein (TIGR02265 family)